MWTTTRISASNIGPAGAFQLSRSAWLLNGNFVCGASRWVLLTLATLHHVTFAGTRHLANRMEPYGTDPSALPSRYRGNMNTITQKWVECQVQHSHATLKLLPPQACGCSFLGSNGKGSSPSFGACIEENRTLVYIANALAESHNFLQREVGRFPILTHTLKSTENISYTIKKWPYFSYTTPFFGLFLIYHNCGI
jgi:hypothetical protein